jgi:hypothetical protein
MVFARGVEDIRNIDDACSPLCTICVLQLLEENLYRLSIGSVLGDQMQALRILDLSRCLICVKLVSHVDFSVAEL